MFYGALLDLGIWVFWGFCFGVGLPLLGFGFRVILDLPVYLGGWVLGLLRFGCELLVGGFRLRFVCVFGLGGCVLVCVVKGFGLVSDCGCVLICGFSLGYCGLDLVVAVLDFVLGLLVWYLGYLLCYFFAFDLFFCLILCFVGSCCVGNVGLV